MHDTMAVQQTLVATESANARHKGNFQDMFVTKQVDCLFATKSVIFRANWKLSPKLFSLLD